MISLISETYLESSYIFGLILNGFSLSALYLSETVP